MIKVKLKDEKLVICVKKKSTNKKKYRGVLLSEINKCFKEEVERHGKIYCGGVAGHSRHSRALGLGSKLLKEFKEKYPLKYIEGLNAFANNDEEKLQESIEFLKSKLKIKLVNDKKHFEALVE